MTDYALGHVKRDPASGDVAIRTKFPNDPRLEKLAWAVTTTHSGPRNAPTSEVDGWEDLYVP